MADFGDMSLSEYIAMARKKSQEDKAQKAAEIRQKKTQLIDLNYDDMSLEDFIRLQRGKTTAGVNVKSKFKANELPRRSKTDMEVVEGTVKVEDVVDTCLQVGLGQRELTQKLGITKAYKVESPKTLGMQSTQVEGREYDQDSDVLKSLDEVVHDRGILRPPKYPERDDNDNLPITGKKAPILKDASEKPGRARWMSTRIRGVPVVADSGPLDPMASSLDALARERGITDETRKKDNEGTKRKSDRMDEGSEEGGSEPIGKRACGAKKLPLTPYRAVGLLAQKGMVIDFRIGQLENAAEDSDKTWRCIVSCGSLKGVADCARKVVARELASKNFLTRLIEEYPDGKIPKYQLPDELFMDPRVMKRIEDLATERGQNLSFEVTVDEDFDDDQGRAFYKFVCTYFLGDEEVIGKGYTTDLAKIAAACKTYKALTGTDFPESKYLVGEKECDLKIGFEFVESEVYHFMEKKENEGMASLLENTLVDLDNL